MAAVAKSKVKSKMGSSESVDGRMARRNSLRFAKTDHAPRILNQISTGSAGTAALLEAMKPVQAQGHKNPGG
jgi:hypothetical protein